MPLIIQLCRDISFGIMCLCFVGFSVAFTSSYWYHEEHAFVGFQVHHGLWRMCDDWLDTCFKIPGTEVNSAYLKWTQTLMCIALCMYIASIVCYSVWECESIQHLKERGVTVVGMFAMSSFIAAGILTSIAVGIFGTECPWRDSIGHPFGWSFAVAITSCCCSLLAGVSFMVIALVCGRRDRHSTVVMTPVISDSRPPARGHSYV